MAETKNPKNLTKVLRLEILKPVNGDWKESGRMLRDIQSATARALNLCMREYFVEAQPRIEMVKARGEKLAKKHLKEGEEKNLDQKVREKLKPILLPSASGLVLDTLTQTARQRWNKDWFKIFAVGEVSLPSYKKGCPISIRDRGVDIAEENESYTDISGAEKTGKRRTVSFKLRPKVGSRIPIDTFILHYKSFDYSRLAIWNRLLAGQNLKKKEEATSEKYWLGSAQILYSERKHKWFANLSYTFPIQPQGELNPKIRVGVDLGITVPLYMAVNNSFARAGLQEEGATIRSFRNQLERRRRALRQNERGILERRAGHGRKHKLGSIEKLRELEDNFRKTANHRLAKGAINFALKQRAGVIVMEDLKGLHERKTQERIEEEESGGTGNRFLEDWSYFELQTMIEQKAKEAGIEVERVKAKYTSQRCSRCGHIDRENRPAGVYIKGANGKREPKYAKARQSDFKCVSCGQQFNADYNAARNLATPDIENIIANSTPQGEEMPGTEPKPRKRGRRH